MSRNKNPLNFKTERQNPLNSESVFVHINLCSGTTKSFEYGTYLENPVNLESVKKQERQNPFNSESV